MRHRAQTSNTWYKVVQDLFGSIRVCAHLFYIRVSTDIDDEMMK